MSGKPAASRAKAAPAKPAAKVGGPPAKAPVEKATAKPAPGKQLATRAAAATRSPVENDADPFDVDTSVLAQAPPVSPRPAKGRMIRIVCPMCETPGFIAAQMQGRDVKCCNPECMVPVFKAPRPERKVEQVAEARGLSTKMLWGGVVGGCLLVGLVGWFFFRDAGPKRWVAPTTSSVPMVETTDNPSGGVEAPAAKEQVGAKITLAEIQKQALRLGVEAARKRDAEGNRSKPICRRMMAEAYAETGDLKEARKQIDLLQNVTSESFYRTEPLVEIAWRQMAAGDRAGALKSTAEAFEATRDLPSFGRAPVSAVASVGAALVAVDRLPEAQQVVTRLNRDDASAISRERVAALVQIANDLKMYDLDELIRYSSLDMTTEPVPIAITVGAAAHGAWDRAIAWALAAPERVTQEDCLTAAAVMAGWESTRTGQTKPVTMVSQASEKSLSAAGQSRVAAGLATGYLMQGNREAAQKSVDQAIALLAKVPRPAALPRPDVKRIHDAEAEPNYGLPDAVVLRTAAIGAAQIARLQVLLGDEAAGWQTFLTAWEFTRGMGPEWTATTKLRDELNNNRAQAEARVRNELSLTNQDLAQRAFNRFSRSIRRWGEAAEDRFKLEVSLLKEAITWGLLDNVATVIANTESVIPSAVGQPYRATSLTNALAEAFAVGGDDAKSSQTAALASKQNVLAEPIVPLIAESERLFRNRKYVDAAKVLGAYKGRHDVEQRRDLRAMQLASRLVKLNQPDLYFPFILALKDPSLIEDSLELTAAQAVREGQAAELWKRHLRQNLSATQQVAFYRGLIAGMAAGEPSKPSGSSQTAAAVGHGAAMPLQARAPR
ncbi:MAG: hypothetical protein KF861_05655 [Planctomycetaceae bacterium]|nr:hypothetical protein [Planctomycetaceae bacterium]